MNRREFLKRQALYAALLGAGVNGLWRPALTLAEGRPDLAVVKGDPARAVRMAVEMLGGMKAFVRAGQRVVIKPNMSFPRGPEDGTTTSPEVVRELAAMCKEAQAAKVLVLDNPLGQAESCLERAGIKDACQAVERDMVHVVTSDRHFQETAIKDAVAMKKTEVMKEVLRADVLIAVPTAKSHSAAGVSLSLKGMMGLVLNRMVMHSQYDLDAAVVDLAGLLKPKLVVIDASRVLSTGGPQGPGRVIKTQTIIAGTDMVAADAFTVAQFEWYGRKFKPAQVRHLKLAAERGLGRLDLDKLTIKTAAA
jgi:uncharacterized protein (DUF362 family)